MGVPLPFLGRPLTISGGDHFRLRPRLLHELHSLRTGLERVGHPVSGLQPDPVCRPLAGGHPLLPDRSSLHRRDDHPLLDCGHHRSGHGHEGVGPCLKIPAPKNDNKKFLKSGLYLKHFPETRKPEIPGPDRTSNCLRTFPFFLSQSGSQWSKKGVSRQGGPNIEARDNLE
jgi:hypothetical protein